MKHASIIILTFLVGFYTAYYTDPYNPTSITYAYCKKDSIVAIQKQIHKASIEDIQAQVCKIESMGYVVKIDNRPMPENMYYINEYGCIVFPSLTQKEYYSKYLDEITIYINSDNGRVYRYLDFILRKIDEKNKWIKSQQPNIDLEKLVVKTNNIKKFK